jgi:hypothetical protein
MGRKLKFPPKHIHSMILPSEILEVDCVQMWCELCGAEVNAMTVTAQNKFIDTHQHGEKNGGQNNLL